MGTSLAYVEGALSKAIHSGAIGLGPRLATAWWSTLAVQAIRRVQRRQAGRKRPHDTQQGRRAPL